MENESQVETYINHDELRNAFIAQSDNLFSFIGNYRFDKPITFDDQVTLFCQIVSEYTNDLFITNQTTLCDGVEYVLVYPLNSKTNIL